MHLWQKVILRQWESENYFRKSFFYQRSLCDLTSNALIQSIDFPGTFLDTLIDRNSEILSTLFPDFLRRLFRSSNVNLNKVKTFLEPLESVIDIPEQAECWTLYNALCQKETFVDSFSSNLIQWNDGHYNGKSMIIALKQLSFISKHSDADLVPILRLLNEIMNEEFSKGKCFEKSYVIFANVAEVFLRFETAKKQFKETVLRNLAIFSRNLEENPEIIDFMSRDHLLLVSILAYEKCIQNDSPDFPNDFILLRDICIQSEVRDDVKIRIYGLMEHILKFQSGCISFEELFSPFWQLLSGRTAWGIYDSIIRLLCTLLQNEALEIDDINKDRIRNGARMLLRNDNSFIVEAAVCLLTVMTKHETFRDHCISFVSDTNGIEEFLSERSEAIVRRKMVMFIRKVSKLEEVDSNLSNRIGDLMLGALYDSDCETRESVLDFWIEKLEEEVRKNCDANKTGPNCDICQVMNSQLLTAMSIAMDDYEAPILQKLSTHLKPLKAIIQSQDEGLSQPKKTKFNLDTASRRDIDNRQSVNEVDKESIMTEVINANDQTLVQKCVSVESKLDFPKTKIPNISVDDFKEKIVDFDCDQGDYDHLHLGLDTVLTDIIQSVKENNKIDGIDCV